MSDANKNSNSSYNNEDEIEIISASDINESVSDSTAPNQYNYVHEAGSSSTDDSVTEAPASEYIKVKRVLTKGDIIRYIILGIAVIIFIAAATRLIFIFVQYKKAQNTYDGLSDDIYSTISSDETEVDVNGQKYPGINPKAEIDFAALKEKNASAVGWIDIPQCGISYPIAQYTDNEYYLSHDFNNDYCYSGAIYLDCNNLPDLSDSHGFIYGHHMQDGSMFAGLLDYDNESFYKKNAENNNNYFYVYLENKINVYEVYSVCDVTYDENREAYYLKMTDSYTIMDYDKYISSIEKYDTGISINKDDKILTLYTCQSTGSAGIRHLVHGKLITTLEY